MPKSERGNIALPVSGLLLLSATLGGLMLFDLPLKSDRPSPAKGFVRETFEDENVRARLWQDPFEATYLDSAAATPSLAAIHEVQTIAGRIRYRAFGPADQTASDKNHDGQNVVLMAAMVPGSNLSEDAEIRRRTRQALVSALAVEGYVASSGEKIGYLNTRWQLPGRLQPDSSAPGISVRIPFEWFEQDLIRPDPHRAKTKWLLVLWLDEEAFRKHTMLKLNELLTNLLDDRGSGPRRDAQYTWVPRVHTGLLKKVKLRLIGPTSSTTLLEMMDPSDRALIGQRPDVDLTGRFTAWLRAARAYVAGTWQASLYDALKLADGPVVVALQEWLRMMPAGISALAEGHRAPPYVLDHLRIYSHRATAPETLLARQHRSAASSRSQDDEQAAPTGTIEDILHDQYDVEFVSTVVRDDTSALALVDELQRRGVELGGNEDHVALISEWDTFYGRALPQAIAAAIQFRCGEASARWTAKGTLKLMLDGSVETPPNVHRFSYMRGLDGTSPQSEGREQSGQKDGDKPLEKPWEVDASQWERPVGASGLDYIRRVADKLTQLDRALVRKGQRLKAIGVVGSDVYDKLLVLQALRARFPNVIFFTTDLDARLLHPSRYSWCRNLVVASSFGLELNADLQREIPPFRDSYQTSAFLACLLALDGVKFGPDGPRPYNRSGAQDSTTQARSAAGDPDLPANAAADGSPNGLAPLLTPRLFEVARTGAYDLTPADKLPGLHPPRDDGRPSLRTFGKLCLLSLIVGLLILPLNKNFRRFCIDRTKIKPRDREALNYFTLLTLFSVAALAALIYFDGESGKGEPFELFAGISIWPTEFCRLFMILLSWVLFILAIISISVSNQKLEAADMLLPDDDRHVEPSFWERWKQVRDRRIRLWHAASRPHRRLMFLRPLQHCLVEWRLFWRARTQISINAWYLEQQRRHPPGQREPVAIGPLWNRYRELGRVGNRLWRCLPLAFVYLAFGWCLTLIFGEDFVPYRGPISAATDKTLMVLSNGALVALTFFVVDATRLCERFIRIVAQRQTSWPATDLITNVVFESGVPLDDLSDFINIQVIARRTETIGKLITYPFILLFIALISGNGYFDNWRWPLQSMLFLGLILAYAVICAFVLRRAAEGARAKSLGRLRRKLSHEHGSNAKNKGARIAQIELMIDEIQSLRRGAFAPWFQHPIVRAILIPFGGVGTVAVLDVLSKLGG